MTYCPATGILAHRLESAGLAKVGHMQIASDLRGFAIESQQQGSYAGQVEWAVIPAFLRAPDGRVIE